VAEPPQPRSVDGKLVDLAEPSQWILKVLTCVGAVADVVGRVTVRSEDVGKMAIRRDVNPIRLGGLTSSYIDGSD
jgi:hypothetical protein